MLVLSACGHARHAAGPVFAAPGDGEPPPSESWTEGEPGSAGGDRQWVEPPAATTAETETAGASATSTETSTETATSTSTSTETPTPTPTEPHARSRGSGAARGALAATKWLWLGTLYVILQTGPAAPILVAGLVYFWPYTLGVTAGVAAIGALVGAAIDGHPAGSTPDEGYLAGPGSAGPDPAGAAAPGSAPY